MKYKLFFFLLVEDKWGFRLLLRRLLRCSVPNIDYYLLFLFLLHWMARVLVWIQGLITSQWHFLHFLTLCLHQHVAFLLFSRDERKYIFEILTWHTNFISCSIRFELIVVRLQHAEELLDISDSRLLLLLNQSLLRNLLQFVLQLISALLYHWNPFVVYDTVWTVASQFIVKFYDFGVIYVSWSELCPVWSVKWLVEICLSLSPRRLDLTEWLVVLHRRRQHIVVITARVHVCLVSIWPAVWNKDVVHW